MKRPVERKEANLFKEKNFFAAVYCDAQHRMMFTDNQRINAKKPSTI